MDNFPDEILVIIYDYMPLPDKRNFVRCSKSTNKNSRTVPIYEKIFQDKMEKKFPIFKNKKVNYNELEKRCMEPIYYGYRSFLELWHIHKLRLDKFVISKLIAKKRFS